MSNRTYNNVTVHRTAKTDTLESVYNATINTVANSLRSNATYAENTQATTASTNNVSVTNLSISSLTLPSLTIPTITQSDITFQNVTISNISTTNLTVTNLNILDNVYLANGSANAPSLSFINDTNTGLYLNNTNELSISCSGTETFRLTNNNVISKENIYLPNGTEAAPAIDNTAFNAGIFYNSGQQSIGFTFTDNSRALLSQDGLVMDTVDGTRILNTDGTEAAPSYTFINDTNTGFYNAVGSLAFSTGGTTRLILNNSSTTFRERVFQNISGSSGFLAIDKNVQTKLSDQLIRNNLANVRQSSNIPGTFTISDIAYHPLFNRYVATSSGNTVLYSSDGGINWIPVALTGNWQSVFYMNNVNLIVCMGNSRFTTSNDGGITFNTIVTGGILQGGIWRARYFQELNRAYAVKGTGSLNMNPIVYTSDGVTFTASTGLTITTSNMLDIAYSPTWNVILTCSSDLTKNSISSQNNLNSFSYYNTTFDITSLDWSPKLQLFAAVSNSGNNGLVYINNTNQRPPVWTLVSTINAGTTSAFSRIRWIDHLNAFVILSNGTTPFYYSYDAYNWSGLTGGQTNLTRTTIFSDSVNGTVFYGGTSGTNNERITFTSFNSRLITQQTLNNSNINSVNSDGKETFKFGLSTNMGNIYELQFSNGLPGNGAFPINPSNSTVANTYSLTNGNYTGMSGGVLAQNGLIYFIGGKSKRILKINPNNDTITPIQFTSSVNDSTISFWGGVVAPNGKIYCIPNNETFVGIFDPVSETLDSTTISGITGLDKYRGGVYARNGYMYFAGYGAQNNILWVRSTDNTFGTISTSSLGTTNGYSGAALGQDGNVYMGNATANVILKIDISSSFTSPTLTTIATTKTSNNATLGPRINNSNTLYFVGSTGAGANDDFIVLPPPYTTPTLSGTFSVNYGSAVLAQDGLIYCIPNVTASPNSTIGIINPVLNTNILPTTIISPLSNNNLAGGVVAPNGKIYCPYADTDVGKILVITPAAAGISNTANLPPKQSTWVLGPSFNKT